MTAASVKVEGVERLQSTLGAAADKVEDLSGVNREVAALVAKVTRPPRRTGRLAGSIQPKWTATEASVTSGLPYAGVIENGWPRRNIRARNFVRTAFANTETTTTGMYRKALQGIADDVKGAYVADKPKLPNPSITVHMADGSVLTVQTLNKDLLAWDRTRAARKWPTADETPSVWMTFLAWTALTREGQIPKMTLAEFEDDCLSAQPDPEDEDDDSERVGPTQEEAEPSS